MKASTQPTALLLQLFKKRVRAGVLQLTLGIGIIVAVISSSMILMAYYARLNILQSEIKNSLRDNAESGIQYLMATRSDIPFYKSEMLDLFGEGVDSVEVIRKPWGLFELFSARAFRGRNQYVKTALITATCSGVTSSALYIPENNSAIYLVGDSRITGAAYLPERKLTTGYLNGRGFEGSKLLNGEFRRSDPSMPLLDATLVNLVKEFLNGQIPGNINYLEQLPSNANFLFSGNQVNCYFSPESIDLTGTLQGNLIVHSETKVSVSSGASLEDIIVIAPEIEIQSGFKGSAQFFATHIVSVKENASLLYPSSLSLVGERDSLISIGRDARVEGITVIPGIESGQESNGVFKIEKGGMFEGVAYINGYSDIQGSLWGHLATKRVQATVNGQTSNNYLIDADINYLKKSPHMPSSFLWGDITGINVAKWIE